VVKVAATINGKHVEVSVPARYTLAELLREKLGLTGTKIGCNRAECGVCTVLVNGTPVFSCTMLAVDANGREIETVENLVKQGALHPLQEAFIRDDALQCGFCTPGMLMALKSLLDKNLTPTPSEIKEAIAGNYCRCGAYPNIVKAALEAAENLRS
jgi:aerobic-type carbon monoxide dehydrogenase small subunit (CoxS/CutS family)